VPLLVCHDEVVVECVAEQAENAMVEGMEHGLNGRDEGDVAVEGEIRIARSWGDRG